MPISTLEARTRILDELAEAVDRIALALACLGEAFELVSVTSADRLESELYMPVQKAYGRGKRTYTQFAERWSLEARELVTPAPGRPSQGAKAFVERAVIAAAEGDRAIADLQDSMLPIESGDAELRSGLTEARELLEPLPIAAREYLRTLGR